jgi:hypothetical protein
MMHNLTSLPYKGRIDREKLLDGGIWWTAEKDLGLIPEKSGGRPLFVAPILFPPNPV